MVSLSRIEVESNHVLPICMNEPAEKLIPIVGIPFHERDNLGKEQFACGLFGFPLALAYTAPGKGVPRVFCTWTQSHDLRVPIDQHLYKVGVRELIQTSAVYVEPAVIKSDRGLR